MESKCTHTQDQPRTNHGQLRSRKPALPLITARHQTTVNRRGRLTPRTAILDYVRFCLSILPTTAGPPEGFLFLCPPENFQIGPSLFKWPDCAAYWSFDPTGADPLSLEDAANLSFPSLRLFTEIRYSSWDADVYAEVRQFHEAKGFDPDSQDVAQHLGCLLYEWSSEIDTPFAHSKSTART
jgi:hypothetical protein